MANARDLSWSWQEIAALLGVSRQAVHKKHAGRERIGKALRKDDDDVPTIPEGRANDDNLALQRQESP